MFPPQPRRRQRTTQPCLLPKFVRSGNANHSTAKGRAKKRLTYTRRFVNVTLTGGKRKVRTEPIIRGIRDGAGRTAVVDKANMKEDVLTSLPSTDEPQPHRINVEHVRHFLLLFCSHIYVVYFLFVRRIRPPDHLARSRSPVPLELLHSSQVDGNIRCRWAYGLGAERRRARLGLSSLFYEGWACSPRNKTDSTWENTKKTY